MRVLHLTVALCLTGGLAESAEESSLSLAERAAAANRTKSKPTSSERVLTNDDLKKAKGNVIFLSATPTAAPAAESPSAPASAMPDLPLGDQRERAARLRGAIEEAQRQLAESTPEQRAALIQRLSDALDEFARACEAIGALNERARQGTVVLPSN